MRVQCLEMVFQTIFYEVCLLHEKEDWDQEVTGDLYWLFFPKFKWTSSLNLIFHKALMPKTFIS
jgi:hypothetical protein